MGCVYVGIDETSTDMSSDVDYRHARRTSPRLHQLTADILLEEAQLSTGNIQAGDTGEEPSSGTRCPHTHERSGT